jgi:hypothetical protein
MNQYKLSKKKIKSDENLLKQLKADAEENTSSNKIISNNESETESDDDSSDYSSDCSDSIDI